MNVLIIGGEVSGDMHGARLISELNKINQGINFIGIGGDKMIAAGLNALYHISEMSFLGFYEVIRHLPFIFIVKRRVLKIAKEKNIKLAILIDYPGFNLSIAKSLKKVDIKIVYYISPQIWAWGKRRLKKIEKIVDKMLVVFPFEKDFYSTSDLNVEFVGHPLIERLNENSFMPKDTFFKKNNLQFDQEILLLMPGSRKHEIKLILPAILPAAIKLAQKHNMQIALAINENIELNLFEKYLDKNIKLISGNTYELLKYSKFGIIKSGTSTLEAALIGLPFVVVYKISFLSYIIGKMLISIRNIAIPNIILGKTVVPELIQGKLNTTKLVSTVEYYLNDEKNILAMLSELDKIKAILGQKNAAIESAKIISGILNEQ